MKAVDLSPEMVEAIVQLQRDANTVKTVIKEMENFILDLDFEGEDQKALKQLLCVKNLRFVLGYCEPFICKNTEQ
jgi:hypothetical protein